jgi:hypothetical protein
MKLLLVFLVVFFTSSICLTSGQVNLIKFREWKKLDFAFPTLALRNEALASKKWIPDNAFPIDVDVDYYGGSFSFDFQ